jgi:uncharacterized protein YoaH (UPF0181 family)
VTNIKTALNLLIFATAFATMDSYAQRAVGERTINGQIVKSVAEVKAVHGLSSRKAVVLTAKQVREYQTTARRQDAAIASSKVPSPKVGVTAKGSATSAKTKGITIISKDGRVSYGAIK